MANPIGTGPIDFWNAERAQATFTGTGPDDFNAVERPDAVRTGVGASDSNAVGGGSNTPQPPIVVGLAMTQLEANRVFQRTSNTGGIYDKGTGSITVPITLTAAADRISYRLRDAVAGGNPVIQNWTTAQTNVPANATSVVCPSVSAQKAWFFVDLRANDDDAQIVLGTARVGMGKVIAISGQSQAVRAFGLMSPATQTAAQIGLTFEPFSSTKVRYTDVQRTVSTAAWRIPADGTEADSPFLARFLTLQVAAAGVNVAVVGHAQGETTVADWGAGTQPLTDLVAVLDSVGGFEEYHEHIGGTDTTNNTSFALYRAGLNAKLDAVAARNAVRGSNFLSIYTATWTRVSGGTVSSALTIRRASQQTALERSAGYYEPHDVEIGDLVHQTSPGNVTYAEGLHRAFTAMENGTSQFGPKILSAARASGSLDIVLTVAHAPGGANLSILGTPANRFSVFNPGQLTGALSLNATTPISVSANKITLKLAADPGNVALDVYVFPPFDPSGTTADENLIRDDFTADGISYGRVLTATPSPISVAQPSIGTITTYGIDSFTDTNGKTVSTHTGENWGWSIATSNWDIQANRVRALGNTAVAVATGYTPPSANHAVEADFVFLSAFTADTQRLLLAGHGTSNANFYVFGFSYGDGGYYFGKLVAGSLTKFGSGALPGGFPAAGTTCRVRMEFEVDNLGSPTTLTIRAYWNGTLVATYTDSSSPFLSGNVFGMRNSVGTPGTTTGIHLDNYAVTSLPTVATGSAALANSMISAFNGRYAGLGAVSTWDTDEVVTSPADLQTKITAYRSTTTQKRRLRCAWNGPMSGGVSFNGNPSLDTGAYDAGGGVLVCNETGFTPAFADGCIINGYRGLHLRGLGFARQTLGGNGDNLRAINIQKGATSYPGRPVVMIEACTIGANYWNPGVAQSEWMKGIFATATSEDIYVKDCIFDGYTDGLCLRSLYGRVENCDFRRALGDDIDCFSFLETNLAGQRVRAWVKRNTFRDYRGASPAHADIFQTGTSDDQHDGYDILFEENIAHKKWSDTGQGGTQGQYNDDITQGKNNICQRNNVICCNSSHALQFYGPQSTTDNKMISSQNTLVVPGANPESGPASNPNPAHFVSSIGSCTPLIENCIADTTVTFTGNEPALGQVTSTGNVLCTANANAATGTKPEDVFKGTFTRTVNNKIAFTLPNEVAGTRAQFVADMWAMFEPKALNAGKGCPDPRGWF